MVSRSRIGLEQLALRGQAGTVGAQPGPGRGLVSSDDKNVVLKPAHPAPL